MNAPAPRRDGAADDDGGALAGDDGTAATPAPQIDGSDWLELFGERSAIYQFEGGLPQSGAEALAYHDMIRGWLGAHPPAWLGSDACFFCGAATSVADSHPLRLVGGRSRVWRVHRGGCARMAWLTRRALARRALEAAGVRPPLEPGGRHAAAA